jgi:hypothetical protein
MQLSEIPLTPDNQSFNLVAGNGRWRLQLLWRNSAWFLDLLDESGNEVLTGMPLVNGYNLLGQYEYLDIGFGLLVVSEDDGLGAPGIDDPGVRSRLYTVTE